MYKVTLTALAAALLLTACGGSDNKSSHKPATPKVQADTSTTPKVGADSAWTILDERKARHEKEAQEHKMALNGFVFKIGDKSYPNAQNINIKAFPQGLSQHAYRETLKGSKDGKKIDMQGEGMMYLFQQKHSAVAALHEHVWQNHQEGQEPIRLHNYGLRTYILGDEVKTLPTSGTYHYHGDSYSFKARDNSKAQQGTFDYSIDFANKMGEGKLSYASGVINLQKAPIASLSHGRFGVEKGIATKDNATGGYDLRLFGANAEEVVGDFALGDERGIMGGTKK